MDNKKLAVCCVADNKVKYLSQALRLIQSLRWFGEDLGSADMFVGYFEHTPAYYLKEYERFGANTVLLSRYTNLHGPSNKMSLLKLERLSNYEYVMLMDCDTIFTGSISAYLNFSGIQAKIADLQTLPHDLLSSIFKSVGKEPPVIKYKTSIDLKDTALYCNSGIVIIAKQYFSEFVERWFAINDFLLENLELLGKLSFFCDQASFALALNEYEHCFRELPLSMNFPSHFSLDKYPESTLSVKPEIIHYHHMVDHTNGYLLDSPLLNIQSLIKNFNAKVKEDRSKHFSNSLFWDFRYNFNPDLGSGIGSKGKFIAYKSAIVGQFCHDHFVEELLDCGCGDLSLLKQIEVIKLKRYIGVDISKLAIDKAKLLYPEYQFVELDLSKPLENVALDISCEHSICFDVLIHQKNKEDYLQVIKNILKVTKTSGLINGFSQPYSYESEILFFHEPLQHTFSNFPDIKIKAIGEYRQSVIYEWSRY